MVLSIVDILKISIPILIIGVVAFLFQRAQIPVIWHDHVTKKAITNSRNDPGLTTIPYTTIHDRLTLSPSTIEFFDKTCNPPATIIANQEGKFENERFDLIKVIVISRHGDRGPLRRVVNLSKVDCSRSSLPYHYEKTAIFLGLAKQLSEDAIEHSDLKEDIFASFGDWLNFTKSSMCHAGMLTQVGVAQHIQLGEILMKAYKKKLNLNGHNIRHRMRVNVTPYPRTYLSSLGFLFGTFLSLNVDVSKDLPQFYFGKEHGYFCGLNKSIKEDYCHQKCPEYARLKNSTVLWRLFDKNDVDGMNVIRRKIRTGFVENKQDEKLFTNGRHILDAMNLFYCHGQDIPLTSAMDAPVEELIGNVRRIIAATHSHKDTISASLLATYGLLKDLYHAFGAMDEKRGEEIKYELYSGHDITLEALNNILRFCNESSIPPYGSRLVFELYQEVSTQRKLVKIIYNGQDMTSNVIRELFHTETMFSPLLPKADKYFGLIQIEFLKGRIAGLWYPEFYTRNFEQACGATPHNQEALKRKHVEMPSNEVEPDQNDDLNLR